MLNLLFVSLLALTSSFGAAELETCRSLYFQENSEANAKNLLDFCSALRADAPLAMAYQGSAKARWASHSFNPYTKYQRFNEGTSQLEEALKQAPEDAEIRFLRLAIQVEAPRFLGYDQHIAEDRAAVVGALHQGWWGQDPSFEQNLLRFLQTKTSPTKTEQGLLANCLKKHP